VLGAVGPVCNALTEAPRWPLSRTCPGTTTLLLTAQWRFSVLQAAVCIAPGPITSGLLPPFSGRLSARFGVPSTVVAGAALFVAAAGGRTASGLAGFDRAWILVVITAAITAAAGLAAGRRIGAREVAAEAETSSDAAAVARGASAGGGRVDC